MNILCKKPSFLIIMIILMSLLGSCDNPTKSNSSGSASETPTIVSIEPEHEATDVSRDATHLYVTFDRPMRQQWSLAWTIDPLLASNELINWQSNDTVVVIAVPTDDEDALFPGAEYRWMLNPSWFDHSERFQSTNGVELEEDFEISFTAAGTPDTEIPSIVDMTLLCGDSLDECGQRTEAPWEFELARSDLRHVQFNFDKPMQAMGWSYTSYGTVFGVSPSWTGRSTFEWEIEDDSMPAGVQEYILNPSTHGESFKSVWGQPLSETEVSITIATNTGAQSSIDANGTIEGLEVVIDDNTPNIAWRDTVLTVETESIAEETEGEMVLLTFDSKIWESGQTYLVPDIGGDGDARVTVGSTIIERARGYLGYEVRDQSSVFVRSYTNQDAEIEFNLVMPYDTVLEGFMTLTLPSTN